MKEIEVWDMMHGNNTEKKSLCQCLDEMGFDRESYMVVRRNDPDLKIGDSYDNQGKLQENKYSTFHIQTSSDVRFSVIANGSQEIIQGNMSDFDAIDRKMETISHLQNNGNAVTGMVGSNNGVYAAMANHGDEIIITKDPEIAAQPESQLHFKDGLGVPLSNGGKLLDSNSQREWETVEFRCKQAAVARSRGTKEPPKQLKSPFRDAFGQINKNYAALRDNQLQGR